MLPEDHKRIPVDWVMDGVAAHIKHILEFLELFLACILPRCALRLPQFRLRRFDCRELLNLGNWHKDDKC